MEADLLASLGVTVSTEASEEHRVLADRLAEHAPPLGELPLKRAANGNWEYVQGDELLPVSSLRRLADLARSASDERSTLLTCLRGRRAEHDELGVALVRATLRELGEEEEAALPQRTIMEHKQAALAAAEMDPRVTAEPKILSKRAAPRALERTAAAQKRGATEWHPVEAGGRLRRNQLRREDSDDQEKSIQEHESSSSGSSDNEAGRVRKFEQIKDDSQDAKLRSRLEALSRAGELGESDDDESAPDDLWIRPRLAARLYAHQISGVRWLWGLHLSEEGGIVGDEMGLGKTAQVAAFLGAVFDKSTRLNRSALVLVPTTMLAHWRRELERWAPRCKVVILHRSAIGFERAVSEGHVALAEFLASALAPPLGDARGSSRPSFVCCVTSYEALHKLGEALLAKKWGYAVLDEGQKIRNPAARVTQLCKRVRTKRRLLLSGTPVQNSLKELWSLFDFASPRTLGTLEDFEAELAAPIRTGGYAGASQAQVQLGYQCAVALKELIRPRLLRRTKAAVCVAGNAAALPPKTEHVLLCRLTPDQLALYTQVLDSEDVRTALTNQMARTAAFRAIAALRKICNHPDLYGGAPDDMAPGDALRSCKLAALDTVLRGWKSEKHRALVFSQSVKMLDIVEALVRARNWNYGRIDGSTAAPARQALADHFNADPRVFCMLLTTRTGGVGMSLIGADRVVLYDPDWNPQTDAQARERAWRLGQTRPVTIYRFICAGTIEEKIYHRQIFKQALTNKVLADPKQRRLFTKSELAELFTLGSAAYGAAHGLPGHHLAEPTTAMLDEAGVVDNQDDSGGEDKKVLTALWDSSDTKLAAVFSHDALDSHEPALQIAAEQEARRAVRALAATAPRSATRALPGTPVASSDILALVARRDAAARAADDPNGPRDDVAEGDDTEPAADRSLALLRRLVAFFDNSRRPPKTSDILANFADVDDPLLFRSILRQVADLRDGRWVSRDPRHSRRMR